MTPQRLVFEGLVVAILISAWTVGWIVVNPPDAPRHPIKPLVSHWSPQ
jgi:hypothetical protein